MVYNGVGFNPNEGRTKMSAEKLMLHLFIFQPSQ
jgi:hypothetical protein